MTEAIRELPSRRLKVSGRHDPLDGHPGRDPGAGRVDIDGEAGRVTVDLSDNDDCLPLGLNVSEACARAGALIAVFNCLPTTCPTTRAASAASTCRSAKARWPAG